MRPALYVLLGALLVPTVGLVGDIVTDGKFKSTKVTGAPLQVASDDMVLNLNADMVDGVDGTNLYTKAEVDTLVVAATDACRPRQYYLTNTAYPTSEVHAACATGFHFAALYEVVDVSNLRYARYHPDALFNHDSGLGPPTDSWGWIRTGYSISSATQPGIGNCDLWTSTSYEEGGTIVRLQPSFYPAENIGWGGAWANCSVSLRVWCIED